jgi:hypothetical protein
MAQYFDYVPNFEYVSRLTDAKKINDYVEVKNLFKRGIIRPDIFGNLAYFSKYKIIGDERPDEVANKIYNNSDLDWLVLLSNNVINQVEEWPLDQQSFQNYLVSKYGSEENIHAVHHYESNEIKDSVGRVVFPGGLEVPQNISVDWYDSGIGEERTSTAFTYAVTNYTYEERKQNDRRSIYVIKEEYVGLVIDNLEQIMPYQQGSTQYVSPSVTRGDNIRLYT